MLFITQFRLLFCLFGFHQNFKSLCFGKEPKQPKRTVSKQIKTNQNSPKFSKKGQNMLSITLFRLLFCLFQLSRNTETLCFGIEPKQPKQRFVSDSAETSFGSSFGCFESKLVSKGHPTRGRERVELRRLSPVFPARPDSRPGAGRVSRRRGTASGSVADP